MSNKNSNFPNAQQPVLKPGEMGENISFAMRFYGRNRAKDPEEVRKRCNEMFRLCIENNVRPGVELLALALGVTRQTLIDWQKNGDPRGEIVTQSKQVIATLIENWGMSGKLNPAAFCFSLKNHFGYSDSILIKAEETKEVLPEVTAADIAARHRGGQPIEQPQLPEEI